MFGKKHAFLLVVTGLFLFLNSPETPACSCMPKPSVLDSFENSELVVATRMVSVEKVREKERQYDIGHIRSAKMVVEKVYKGNVRVGDMLTFGQGGGGDCIWTFDEEWIGTKFLFYLGKPTVGHPFFEEAEPQGGQPMYHAVSCGRSIGLENASDDLLYLDNLDKVRGKTRISGRLTCWGGDCPNLSDRKINILGKEMSFQVKTDKNGIYQIYDMPPGQYLIEPEIPNGWKINVRGRKSENQVSVVLQAGKHIGVDFYFHIDNAIRGRVFSPTGQPMKGVCLKAVSTGLMDGDYQGRFGCTDEKGLFEINEIPPGNYILVVNDDGKINEREPFGTLFYPGVADRKNAGVVSIEAGKFVKDISIQIPKVEEMTTISGKFFYADGNPVNDGYVKFEATVAVDRAEKKSQTRTDKEGRFTIRILKGLGGVLFGEKYTHSFEFNDCPELKKELEKKELISKNITTESLEITGGENLADVKFVLPIRACRKPEN